MLRTIPRVIGWVRGWFGEGRPLVETRLEIDRVDRSTRADLLRPDVADVGSGPAWILLHGVTRPGVDHAQFRRFARAMAASGSTVVLPEVPEWVALDLTPDVTIPTVRAAAKELREFGHDTIGLMGFSFGAPQALIAAADSSLGLAAVAGFGGYLDLERTLRFQMTGRFEWGGEEYRLRPDPYGRWIVASNFLTGVPGYEDATDVAAALGRLAAEAGDMGEESWNPIHDPLKRALRAGVAPARRELFDLFAPPSGREPEPGPAEAIVPGLAAAARKARPLLEPAEALGSVTIPVHLVHGRNDHLIPHTETLRLGRRLREAGTPAVHAAVTGLFGHSQADGGAAPSGKVRESISFLRALGRVLDAC